MTEKPAKATTSSPNDATPEDWEAAAQNHLLAREDEGIKCILALVQDGDNGTLRLNQVKDYVSDVRRCLKALQATPAIEL